MLQTHNYVLTVVLNEDKIILEAEAEANFPRPKITFNNIMFTTQTFQYINVSIVITAQCILVHMRGLGIACRPSVRPSVRLSVCPSVCDVGGLWSHRMEILETNYTDN